jgi:hypothetical protein
VLGAGVEYLGDGGGADDDLAGDQPVAGGEHVAATQLDRVHPEGVGQPVHLGLVGEAGLHGPEAAHGPTRRVVGAHDGAVDVGAGHAVGAGGEAGGVGDDGTARGGVGASVEYEAGLDPHEAAVAVGVVPVPHAGRVPVHVAVERLLAGVHHLHGPPGVERQQAEVDVEAQVLAGAERPAHAGEGEPHPLGLEAEAGSDLVAVDVQPLGGDEEVDAAVLGGHGQPGLGAEEGLVLHADLVGPLDLYLADGALVAVAEVDAPDEVAVGVDRVRRLGL